MSVTVIIPVYNGGAAVIRCLNSLAAQTCNDFKVLIIDDGSTDSTPELIREFRDSHPGMRLEICSRKNRGVAETRNDGIGKTETEYLTFIDQDDEVTADYLAVYLQAIRESRADIICGGYLRVHPETNKVLRQVSPGNESWAKFVVTAPWAHLYRTDFLKQNDIRFLKTAIGEDLYFTLMAYARTKKIVTIGNTGYHWMDNPESHSNSRQKQVREDVDPFVLLEALRKNLPKDREISEEELQYFLYRYVVWYLLFTLRGTEREVWKGQYRRLIAWLREVVPGFEKNRMISLFGPKGEPIGIRAAVWSVNVLYRLGIAETVLGWFCKR